MVSPLGVWTKHPADTAPLMMRSFVRGRFGETTGYIVERAGPSVSRLSYVLSVDPQGLIPNWVVNLAAPSQAMNVGRLRDHAHKIFGRRLG